MKHLGLGLVLETLLKSPENLYEEMKGTRLPELSVKLGGMGLACYFVYGLLVGSFSGGMQWWASPVKIAAGMVFSTLICLPSLYIFGCLSRSNATLRQCFSLQAGLLAMSGVLLIGFFPVGWVFSTSVQQVPLMGFLHLLFWWAGLLFGLRLLRLGITSLGATTGAPIRLWCFIFVLVCLQMTATLAPLLGPAESFFEPGKRFFLTHWVDSLSADR